MKCHATPRHAMHCMQDAISAVQCSAMQCSAMQCNAACNVHAIADAMQ